MAGQWNYNGNGNNQMTQAQQNAWQGPNYLTPEQIAQMRRNQEADFRNSNDVNDSAIRNANPDAWWYGGEGPDVYNAEKAMLERRRQEYANRVGPQVDQSGYNTDRVRDTLASQQQNAGLGMLYKTATGQGGPSVAQMQAGNQVAQAAANMRAQAASARGGGVVRDVRCLGRCGAGVGRAGDQFGICGQQRDVRRRLLHAKGG